MVDSSRRHLTDVNGSYLTDTALNQQSASGQKLPDGYAPIYAVPSRSRRAVEHSR